MLRRLTAGALCWAFLICSTKDSNLRGSAMSEALHIRDYLCQQPTFTRFAGDSNFRVSFSQNSGAFCGEVNQAAVVPGVGNVRVSKSVAPRWVLRGLVERSTSESRWLKADS